MKTKIPKKICSNSEILLLTDTTESTNSNTGKLVTTDRAVKKTYDDMIFRTKTRLTSNKNFYVNKETGSDEIVDGIGESEDKPFKSIQACIDYVVANYDVSSYVAYVNFSNTTYSDKLVLSDFTRTTGSICIQGQGVDSDSKFEVTAPNGNIIRVNGGSYILRNFNMIGKMTDANGGSSTLACFLVTGGSVSVYNVNINMMCVDQTVSTVKDLRAFNCAGGILTVYNFFVNHTNASEVQIGSVFVSSNLGVIKLPDTSANPGYSGEIRGDYKYVACAFNQGKILVNGGSGVNKFQFKNYELVTGQKFRCQTGGIINTFGQGLNFFPGDTEGTIDTERYSWYA